VKKLITINSQRILEILAIDIEKILQEAREAQDDVAALASTLAVIKKSTEEVKTTEAVLNEVKGEVNSLKRDIRCLKYELKKQKSISDQDSGNDVASLKYDVFA
jgi:hypothetical protein